MRSKKLYALDFDGVICDSALETAVSGWRTARMLWPELPEQIPDLVLSGFRQVRPAMETGYEAILICKALHDGVSVDQLVGSFSDAMQQLMLQNNCDASQLKTAFAACRDQWIADDFDDWLQMNPLYPGIVELLNNIPVDQLFIVTTKQQRFVSAILSANGFEMPETRIYGLEKKLKKPLILQQLQDQHRAEMLVFIEDRLATLKEVISETALESIRLGLAIWGYNTDAERQLAEQQPRIHLLAGPADILMS